MNYIQRNKTIPRPKLAANTRIRHHLEKLQERIYACTTVVRTLAVLLVSIIFPMILTLILTLWDGRNGLLQSAVHLLWPRFQLSSTIQPYGSSPTLHAFLGTDVLSSETQRALSSWTSNTLTNTFLLDSGCTRHMFHRQEFESIVPLDDGEINTVTGIGGHVLKLRGKGTVVLPVKRTGGEIGWLRMNNVVYCPGLGTNLLSCLNFIRTGVKVELDRNGAALTMKGRNPVTFTASISKELFCLDVDLSLLKERAGRPGHNNTYNLHQQRHAYMAQFQQTFDALEPAQETQWYRVFAAYATKEAYAIWHERLGHLGEENLVKLQDMTEGMDLRAPPALCTCEACLEGRMTKAPHKGHIAPGRYPDELIHMD